VIHFKSKSALFYTVTRKNVYKNSKFKIRKSCLFGIFVFCVCSFLFRVSLFESIKAKWDVYVMSTDITQRDRKADVMVAQLERM